MLSAGLFAAIFLLFLVGPAPFRDFSSVSAADLEQSNPLVQLTFSVAFVFAGGWVLLTRRFLLVALVGSSTAAMFTWLAFTSSAGSDPLQSLKRLVLAAMVTALAAAAVTLPASLRQLSTLLASVCLVTLGLCYFGVVALPGVAIHHDSDLVDPALDGLWRGVFQHKNIAAPMMADFVFIGLFVARRTSRLPGYLIVVLSVAFLAGSGGKTALVLCPVVLALVHIHGTTGSRLLRGVVATAPLILLNAATLGSVVFPPIANLNTAWMADPSFTGRTDIWKLGIDGVANRPLLGYGFTNFWRAPVVVRSESEVFEGNAPDATVPEWVKLASHSHNSLLDISLSAGLPGGLLFMWWVVFAPLANLERISRRRADSADFARLLTRIWLLGTCTMSLEALAFDRTNPAWFTVLFAIFGLRMLDRVALREEAAAAAVAPRSEVAARDVDEALADETSTTAIALDA